ncbi:protein kinase [Planctomycetota bacterium]
MPGWDTPPTHERPDTHKSADSDKDQIFVTIADNEPMATVGFGFDLPIAKGDVLGDRYKIIQSLGVGGFGAVYQVEDLVLNEQMALKVVVTGEGKAQRASEQILHEFKLREKINDLSHIVKAQDPRPCEFKGLSLVLLPMEFADGRSMRHWLAQHQNIEKRQKEGLELFKQACLGVKAIHDAGLVHLDIKPENILLANGKAKIADFGIGRYGACQFSKNPDQLLRQGIGTPQYMSPEQFHVARQKDVGPASDIYSLGIVLFELLDGNLPFDGTPIELRDKHLKMSPPQLPEKLGRWWGIVKRCLEKKVEDRYHNIKQLIKDLERVVQGTAISTDVSCPQCGHINANPVARECDKCRTNLAPLFRLCPVCDKSVRLDIETCTVCGKAVAAHYRLLDRKERIEKLKDEDPVEAIELLETVLQQESEDYNERAIQLLKDLRKKQSQINSLTAQAYKAESVCLPEKAIEIWQEILRIIPRHRIALDQVQKLESLMKDFRQRLEKTITLMDEAKFENADKLLQGCLELIPTRKDVKEMLESCRKRAQEYATTSQRALISQRKKLIQDADKQINKALLQAPRSDEALALADKIHEITEKTNKLLYQAKLHLTQAKFSDVDKIVNNIEESQTDNDAVVNLKKELAKIRISYPDLLKAARSAVNSRDLDRVPEIIEKVIALCPESPEAQSLLEQAKNDQEKAHNLIEETTLAITAAKFEEAGGFLAQVEGLWPTMSLLKNSRKKLKEVSEIYNEHMKCAKQAKARMRFAKALKEVELAYKTCPSSPDIIRLKQEIKTAKANYWWHAIIKNIRSKGVVLAILFVMIVAFFSSFVYVQKKKSKIKVNQLLSYAKSNNNKENYEVALTTVKEVLYLVPNHRGAKELYQKIISSYVSTDIGWWISKAKASATALNGTDQRAMIYCDIVEIQARTGDIDGAKITASHINNPNLQSRAYCSIVGAQAKKGDIAGAKATATKIVGSTDKHLFFKSMTYCHIAKAQAKMGNKAAVRDNLKQIKAIEDTVHEKFWNRVIYAEIAEAQVEINDIVGAKATVANLKDDDLMKRKVYEKIVVSQLKAGGVDKAKAVATGISDNRTRKEAFVAISEALVDDDNIKEAKAIAEYVEDSESKDCIYEVIIKGQLDAGDIISAMDSVLCISKNREASYCAIVGAQASAGDIIGAKATAAKLSRHSISGFSAYNLIAKAQAKMGDIKVAQETFKKNRAVIETVISKFERNEKDKDFVSWYKPQTYIDIVRAQAWVQDFAGAKVTAANINDSESRNSAYCAVAEVQAEVGDIRGAMVTTAEISDNSKKKDVLSSIVKAKAKTSTPEILLSWIESLKNDYSRTYAYLSVAESLIEKTSPKITSSDDSKGKIAEQQNREKLEEPAIAISKFHKTRNHLDQLLKTYRNDSETIKQAQVALQIAASATATVLVSHIESTNTNYNKLTQELRPDAPEAKKLEHEIQTLRRSLREVIPFAETKVWYQALPYIFNPGERIMTFEHNHDINTMLFSPDGRQLVTSSEDKTAVIWDIATGQKLREFKRDSAVDTAIFSPDGKQVFISSTYLAGLYDVRTGEKLWERKRDGGGTIVAFSSDGKRIALSKWKSVLLLDAKTGQKLREFKNPNHVEGLIFSPNGKRLLIKHLGYGSSSQYVNAIMWNVEIGRKLWETSKAENDVAAFSPDGKHCYTSIGENVLGHGVYELDTETGRQLRKYNNTSTLITLRFLFDSKVILMSTGSNGLLLWDVRTGQKIWPVHKDHHIPPYPVLRAFSPNCRLAVSRRDATRVSHRNIATIWYIGTFSRADNGNINLK